VPGMRAGVRSCCHAVGHAAVGGAAGLPTRRGPSRTRLWTRCLMAGTAANETRWSGGQHWQRRRTPAGAPVPRPVNAGRVLRRPVGAQRGLHRVGRYLQHPLDHLDRQPLRPMQTTIEVRRLPDLRLADRSAKQLKSG
jgi:hypothetical protein